VSPDNDDPGLDGKGFNVEALFIAQRLRFSTRNNYRALDKFVLGLLNNLNKPAGGEPAGGEDETKSYTPRLARVFRLSSSSEYFVSSEPEAEGDFEAGGDSDAESNTGYVSEDYGGVSAPASPPRNTPGRVLSFVRPDLNKHRRVCQARGLVKALRGPEGDALNELMGCFKKIDNATDPGAECNMGRTRGLATGLLLSEETSLALLIKLLGDLTL
jgi:hypothetical protein